MTETIVALSNQDQVDVRRHCGYGFLGAGERSLMYWRYFPHYNTLEYRMTHLQQEEVDLISDTYLPALNQLEMQMAKSGDGAENDDLDTSRAAVWYRNENEISDRTDLYGTYRKMLCNVLQIPPGPWFQVSSSVVRMRV